jgi:hypothetical protein
MQGEDDNFFDLFSSNVEFLFIGNYGRMFSAVDLRYGQLSEN